MANDRRAKLDGSNPFARRTEVPPLDVITESMIRPVERTIEVPVPTPIVQQEGISWIGNFGISTVGMYVNVNAEQITEDEWRNFFTAIKGIEVAYQFIVGDWAAFGGDALSKTYEEIAALTGYEAGTIEVWASVCRKVDKLIRINSLGIAHHQVVAPLPYDEQRYWLEFAAAYDISYRELQRRIAEGDHSAPAPKVRQALTADVRFQRAADPFEARIVKIAARVDENKRREWAQRLRDIADRVERGEF